MASDKELNRRELMKLALLGGGYVLLPADRAFARVPASFVSSPRSPELTPFRDDVILTVPPPIPSAEPFSVPREEYDVELERRCATIDPTARFIGDNTTRNRIVAESRKHQFHPELPPTTIWGYRPEVIPLEFNGTWPFAQGPTLIQDFGVPLSPFGCGKVVKYTNNLPKDHVGFGSPYTTVHFHGGHHPSRADGFPTNLDKFPDFVVPPGGAFNYYFPTLDPGTLQLDPDTLHNAPVPTERPSTLWYHDHFLDFTNPNVYRGLAGFLLLFDAPLSNFDANRNPLNYDSSDEEDPDDFALRLPSGIGVFDIPLVIQDKLFAPDGSLVFEPFNHNGFLGDTFCVNGTVQPTMFVQRRRYRFRFLNASNARIYSMFLTNELGFKFPMHMIGTDSSLMGRPILNIESFTFGVAERVEVVIDFGAPEFASETELFIENRLRQTSGKKPSGIVKRGDKIMRFILQDGVVDDPSRVGRPNDKGVLELRPFAPISLQELDNAVHRTFKFNRSHGAWTINGKLAGELEEPTAQPRAGKPEIWHLVNSSGGWWHPIHIHLEMFRILRRGGKLPPLSEQDGISKKEVFLLRANDSVDVFANFRDYLGPFVFHCHNLAHEDAAMMARFDVEE